MNKSKCHYLVLILFFTTSFLFAQSGRIQGYVTDETTGDVLVGANITLEGTSLGASTDLEGKYAIEKVPVGSYTLSVRYIGYKEKETTVEVVADQTTNLTVSLLFQALEGETIVIQAQAEGQLKAINEQLSSNTIKNVVSAEKIHELPDADAATALSRLPGVSLMNGDQVVIRGMEAKLNQVLLNGIQLPSTDMNNRSTSLGFVSSNLLSGIEVIKAITPDMDANTLGGVVNLRLREAPEGFHFDALSQGSYNAQDHVADNYTFWASLSSRFFNDKLGVFVQGNMDRTNGGGQSARISPTQWGEGDQTYGNATFVTTGANFGYDANLVKNSGGSLILDYRLPNGKIVMQNTYSGNQTDQNGNQIQLNFNTTPNISYTVDRQLYGKDLWINALQGENTFGAVKVEAGISHSFTQRYTDYGHALNPWTLFNSSNVEDPFGTDNNGNPIKYTGDIQHTLTFDQALGILDNINPEDAENAVLAGWTSERYDNFKQHLYNGSLDLSTPFNFSKFITAEFKTGGKLTRTTRENDIDIYFAHDAPDKYANPESNIYFGPPALSESNPLRFTQVMDTDFDRGQYYLDDFYDFKNGGFKYVIDPDKYDPWLKLSKEGWASALMQNESWMNDWRGAEVFSAGYLMGTINVGQNLTLLGGARLESYNMKYHAQFTHTTHSVYGDCATTYNGSVTVNDNPDPDSSLYHIVPYNSHNVDRTDNDIFPNVQLKYDINNWSDIRLAYTTGISRPDYTAIIPKVEFRSGAFQLGNPKLRPSKAQAFDIIGSFHNNEIGLFTIDFFYKEIEDQMYNTSIYLKNRDEYAADVYVPDSTFLQERFGFDAKPTYTIGVNLNNGNLGFIRGIELDWQTTFWYLPGVLKSLVLNVNYTKSSSGTRYTRLTPTVTVVRDTLPNGRIIDRYLTSTVESSFEGRLIHQANDVLNVALGADYKGFHSRLSFSMTGNVINSVGSRPENAGFTGNIYRWDFTIKQELPIAGLSLSLNGTNIFHNPVKTYRKYRKDVDLPVTKNLVSIAYYPSVFSMNLRYSF